MNIVICDDNPIICTEISNYLTSHFKCNVKTTTNSAQLLKLIENNKNNIDSLILDIVLNESKNGIEVASEIHKEYPMIKIIFLTGYDNQYYNKIFADFQPFGFIAKPVQYNILNFFMRKIQIETEAHNRQIEFISEYKNCKLPVKEIICIQSRKRICEISTKNHIYSVYAKISDLETQLSESFVRSHQSYLVNLDYVESLNGNRIILKNGDNVPISRKYSERINNVISATLKNNRRSL